VTRVAVHEPRQDRGEKNDGLGVRNADDESLQRCPSAATGCFGLREGGDQAAALPHGADAEPYQIQAASQFDDREHQRGPFHQRANAQSHADGHHLDPHRVAYHRGERRAAAVSESTPDHEEHARAGDHDENEGCYGEREQLAGGDHVGTLTHGRQRR